MKERLAIIGSGIAGLGCAHFLHKRFDLTVFEQNDYIGGHTNTIEVEEAGRKVWIDTGFMVFNHATYPNLCRLFRELGVETKKTEMSFSVQHLPTNLEYNGGSVNLLFGQRRNVFRPRHWRMLLAIDRFNKEALSGLEDPRYAEMSLRDYVMARRYGQDMLDLYLVPMSSAVWSTPPEKMDEFPATTLLRFWHNHGFLGLDTQHQWWTVCGGSKSYVAKITAPFRDRIMVGRKAVRVTRRGAKANVRDASGAVTEFDKIVLACHGDQALGLLGDPTDLESRLLKEFKYQPNTATVHTDTSFMPKTRRCWASWNYRIDAGPHAEAIPTTHYWMNRLQGVSDRENYFVSLNCHDRVAPEKVLRRIEYEHPLFSLGAIRAQKELPALNNLSTDQTTYYAGAWFKYGFHEDGFTSGLECARAITREPIWTS
jgi:predicted NAD/FAD-binding protein